MPKLTDPLSGRALFYVAVIFAGLTGSFQGFHLGLVVLVGFIAWTVPAWGSRFDLHRLDEEHRNDKRHSANSSAQCRWCHSDLTM